MQIPRTATVLSGWNTNRSLGSDRSFSVLPVVPNSLVAQCVSYLYTYVSVHIHMYACHSHMASSPPARLLPYYCGCQLHLLVVNTKLPSASTELCRYSKPESFYLNAKRARPILQAKEQPSLNLPVDVKEENMKKQRVSYFYHPSCVSALVPLMAKQAAAASLVFFAWVGALGGASPEPYCRPCETFPRPILMASNLSHS